MGDRIRVMGFIPSLMGGGAERQMVLLLKHLDRERFAPALCLIERSGELLEEVPADVAITGLGKTSPRDVPRLIVRLAGALRANRPDVVLAKVDYANQLISLARPISRLDVPLVLGEESVPTAAAQAMSLPRIRLALLGWAYRKAAYVTAPSPGVEQDIRDGLSVPDTHIEVIPNMIDVADIRKKASAPASSPFPDPEVPLVVTAGRMQPAKGQADLISAVERINRTRPCNLLILGDGADRGRLERLVDDLDLADRARFTGFVENPVSYMAAADVFVSPSYFESFGNVIVEAMCAGVPVISTKVPAGPEWLIADGETGLFARPRDPDDLALKITTVLDDPTMASGLSARARDFAARYDAREVVPSYERLLIDAARRPDRSDDGGRRSR